MMRLSFGPNDLICLVRLFFFFLKLFILCFYSFIFVISELVVFNHVELCSA